ncbi:MAG: cyclic nucleotide-binding protein [Candidatus Magnetoglobus multicellularis str. Araruama]|uniref:Cyclic nucleotide-binding protein n=1 Tax=Candidatus Magnetoglobus multicellularis str. Araruama TaxID=890399 RepID=A0A1V1PFH0_9BACT|nr:MAG: cyclic nucleotide-binding protein [Candidatus Magnetoglobus multicellularis str. Araruama]
MAKGAKGYNIKTFLKGQTIFKEGDPGNLAYLIRSGSVDIYKVMNNKKILLERLQPGEIFGEMSIISKEPRSANAAANEYSELVVINQKDLEVSISKSLPIVQALANLLIKRLRHTSEMIREHPTNNIFLSTCNILYLLHENLTLPKKVTANDSFQNPKII